MPDIRAPLPHIPMHVVQAPCVRLETTYRSGFLPIDAFRRAAGRSPLQKVPITPQQYLTVVREVGRSIEALPTASIQNEVMVDSFGGTKWPNNDAKSVSDAEQRSKNLEHAQ
jgi:hypothetical protein